MITPPSAIVHSVLLTIFAVTGHYQVRPGVFKKNISTQQSTWTALEDGGSKVVALEDGGGAVALGGDIGRWFLNAAVALGGSGGRRTCYNIRSAKQDDIYGASNIILPCPGS